jgi:hypothetical protein
VQVSGGTENHRLEKDWNAVFDIPTQTFDIKQPTERLEMMPSLNYEINRKPLKEVVKDIEKYFKVDIVIETALLGSCIVKANFAGAKLEVILDVITDSCECTYEKTNKGYIIKQ